MTKKTVVGKGEREYHIFNSKSECELGAKNGLHFQLNFDNFFCISKKNWRANGQSNTKFVVVVNALSGMAFKAHTLPSISNSESRLGLFFCYNYINSYNKLYYFGILQNQYTRRKLDLPAPRGSYDW